MTNALDYTYTIIDPNDDGGFDTDSWLYDLTDEQFEAHLANLSAGVTQ